MEATPVITAALTYRQAAINDRPLVENPVVAKQAQVKQESRHVDHTLNRMHNVGQMDHNLHKL
jgi:hypothetical protein